MKQFNQLRRGNIMALLALFVFGFSGLLSTVPVQAAVFEAGDQVYFGGERDELAEGDRAEENIYAVGSKVTLQLPVLGDVLFAGQEVRIEDDVEGDVWAAGETVTVRGDVTGDLRLAGQNVTVSGVVTGDVLIAAEQIYLEDGAEFRGDVRIAASSIWGGSADILGDDTKIYADYMGWDGLLNGGDLHVRSLTLQANTEVTGDLTHYSPAEATVLTDDSNVTWVEVEGKERSFNMGPALKGLKDLFLVLQVVSSVTFIVSAMVFYAVFRKWLPEMIKSYTKNWETIGLTTVLGMAGVFLIPIAAFVLVVSVLTSGLGLAIGFAWLILMLLGKWVTAPVIGAWLMKWFKKADAPVVNVWTTLLGACIIAVASLWLPLNLILCIFYLFGTGIILRKALSHWM